MIVQGRVAEICLTDVPRAEICPRSGRYFHRRRETVSIRYVSSIGIREPPSEPHQVESFRLSIRTVSITTETFGASTSQPSRGTA